MPSLAVIGWGLPFLYVQHSLWWHFHIKCRGLRHISMSEEWVKIQGLELMRFKPAVSFYLLVLVHLFFFQLVFGFRQFNFIHSVLTFMDRNIFKI